MKTSKIYSIISILIFGFSISNVNAEKLKKMIVLNFGNWKFSDSYTYPYWNSFANFTLGSTTDKNPMWNIDKEETSISVEITDDFGGQSGNGPNTLMSFSKFDLSNAVTSSLYLGVAGNPMGGGQIQNPTAAIELSGFDVNYTYNIYALCALRTGAGGSADGKNRETQLTVTGSEIKTDAVNVVSNTSLLEFLNIEPTTDRKIEIKFAPGSNNESTYKDFYINTLVVETADKATIIDQDVSSKSQLSVYPNPFVEEVTVMTPKEIQTLTITDLNGKVVYTQNVFSESQFTLNLDFLNSGFYFLQTLMENNRTETVKLIKK